MIRWLAIGGAAFAMLAAGPAGPAGERAPRVFLLDDLQVASFALHMAPYALGERTWTHQQISGWTPEEIYPVFRRAALRYDDPTFQAVARQVPRLAPADRGNLTHASKDR